MDEPEKTAEELLQAMTPERFEKAREDVEAERLRRERASRHWVCLNPDGCGQEMGYDYIQGDFFEEGCFTCGYPKAVEVTEASDA